MNESEAGSTIPELLGFHRIDRDHKRAFSLASYQAQYILYEDEAAALLQEFAPDEHSAKGAHPHIDRVLHLRFAQDEEYKARVLGGYPEMERRMQTAGVIPEEEEQIKRKMNRLMGAE